MNIWKNLGTAKLMNNIKHVYRLSVVYTLAKLQTLEDAGGVVAKATW